MPPLLQLQKLPGKGDGGWKKVSLRRFLAEIAISWEKNAFLLLLFARHILTAGLQKCF